MKVNGRDLLNNVAAGSCPAPAAASTAQVVMVQNGNAGDCTSQGCPAPTREGVKIDPNKLFTEDCGEITITLRNDSDVTVVSRWGLRSVQGSYFEDNTAASAVDNPQVKAMDYPTTPGNAPTLQYVNWATAFTPIIIRQIYISATGNNTNSQVNQKMTIIQRELDPTDPGCAKKINPSLCDVCDNNNIDPNNQRRVFSQLISLDYFNGFEYPILAGEEIEFRLCVAGQASIREFSSCE